MIQSLKELLIDARNGEKKAKIFIEIDGYAADKYVTVYKVKDYAVDENNSKVLIASKDYRMTNEQINQADLQLHSENDFSNLSKTEREFLKIKLMLFYLTKQSPLYCSAAEDWELC